MVDFVSLFTGMSERDIGFLLKSLVQDSINSELTNAEISEIDNKTQVLITNSKDVELMNDISIQSAINIEPSTVYLMPEEPDGINLKLWVKFQNAGELRDWSYQKNKSYSTGANTMPGLFSKYNDNSMLKYELYSYFNGANHYAYTLDGPPTRIQPNIITNKITSFFMRLVPVSLAKLLYVENNVLFTKVDDDQLRYGYSVTIDTTGNMHFYIRNNYTQFHLFIKDAYNYILTDPLYQSDSNFRFENFSKKNFLTGFQYLCGLVDAELPFHDWFFKYNPVTHNMSAINTTENNVATVISDTSLITPAPYLSVPLQEGKYTHLGTVQTTIYDNSGHNNNAVVNNLTLGGQWNDDNTLSCLGSNVAGTGGGISIQLPSITPLNSLTEFTITFWFNPLDEVINPRSYIQLLVSKGFFVSNSFSLSILNGTGTVYFNINGTESSIRTNCFPIANKWYFVVAKWKSGEYLKLYIDNSVVQQSAAPLTTTIANSSNNLKLFGQTDGKKGKIALFKFYTTQISQGVQDDLFYAGYHNPLFPKSENIQPVVEEVPDPVFVPFTNAYTLDKMPTPVLADYRKINSLSGDNPFLQRYYLDDGVATTDPELNPYTILDGSTTASDPETRIGSAPATIDSSNNSNGTIGDGDNDAYTLKIDAAAGTGIGDTMIGKKLTKAIVWMRKTSTPITGTLYFRIWNATTTTLTPVATLGSVSADSLTQGSSGSEWYPITFSNPANTVALADGYRIGVEYQGAGSGDIVNVQRQTPRADVTTVQQTFQDGAWKNVNTDYTMKCDLYTGAGTVATEPNIIMKTGSYNRVAQAFGTGDSLIGKIIGKVILRLKKVGSPTGTATVVLETSTVPNTPKATLGTIDVSTIATTTTDYTFTNYTHGQAAALVDRISILWTPSASGEVHVMTNKGNTSSNSWNGTNSSVFKYISSWAADSTIDLAGKIYTGGNNFDPYLQFSTTTTRVCTKIVNSSSSLHNKKITQIIGRFQKTGSPAGTITATIRDPNDVVRVQYSAVDVDNIPTDSSYHDVILLNVVHNYYTNSTTGSGDKISWEYSGSDNTSNYIRINTNKDLKDGLNTITQTFTNGNYVDYGQRDLAAGYYEGGEPDLNSRTRVVQSIEHQNSILKGKKITRVKAFLYRTTVGTSGTAYCNVRNSADSLIKTLGTVGVSGLNTTPATPSEITFTDTTNNYPFSVGDKVSIEFSGGNTTDQLGVLVREVTPNYDLSNSYIRKYDEVDYDDSEPTKDLCAVMDEGGFSFVPDAGFIPDPTPTNIKDLLYCAGNNAKSGFFETFLMEFRIYAKDITLLNADNIYNNRYSISSIGHGEILCPFSLKMNTTDAV